MQNKKFRAVVHYTKCGLVSTAVCGVRAAALYGVLVMGDVASVHRTEVVGGGGGTARGAVEIGPCALFSRAEVLLPG